MSIGLTVFQRCGQGHTPQFTRTAGLGMDGDTMRRVVLEIVAERAGQHSLQSASVVNEAARRLELDRHRSGIDHEQALLSLWWDLLRTGYIAWGYDLANPNPPFCHLTERGRRILSTLSRDPSNPEGYLRYLRESADLNPIAWSYLEEALAAYNSGLAKSAAVMLGVASESLVLSLRDRLVERLTELHRTVPKGLTNWRLRTVLEALETFFQQEKGQMQNRLSERVSSFWPAYTQQIRSARNDAGHPSSIAPIEESTVHASLLLFPELASLAADLERWAAELA